MSEGYVFTSASDVNDLLNQIVSQAALHGWTQNHLGGQGGQGRRGHISKDGVTLNLCSMPGPNAAPSADTTQIDAVIPAADRVTGLAYNWRVTVSGSLYYWPDVLCINAGTGYNGGSPWYRQPGADVMAANNLQGRFRVLRAKGAIGKVHMFFYENPAAIYVWAEVRAGEWYWLAGGNLQKDTPFEGGQFYGASVPDNNTVTEPEGFQAITHRIVSPQVVTVRGNGWASGYQTAPDRFFGASAGLPDNQQVPGYPMWSTAGVNNDQTSEVQTRGYDMPTGRTWIHPPRAYAQRLQGAVQVGMSYLGVLPGVYFTTSEPYIGGEVFSLGGQSYMALLFNWRVSPYNKDTGTATALAAPWSRNNNYGSALALRKPN